MCGIVGYVGRQDALPLIIGGLERLEYRGYDSAGVAVLENAKVEVTRAPGKLLELKKLLHLDSRTKTAPIGIGHTRWATHGKPSEANAHPHRAGRVSLVHNGIIENYLELKAELKKSGAEFKSETDSEVASHLLNKFLEQGLKPFDAFKSMCAQVHGSFAFLAFDSNNPDRLLVAKNFSPLIIGLGEGENFIASDIPAVLQSTRKIIVLEEGDIAEVTATSVHIENNGKKIERPIQTVNWDPATAQKGGYKHFMLKEINEQAQAITDTFRGRARPEETVDSSVFLNEFNLSDQDIKAINRIVLVACGTAWHACLMAKFHIEEFARIPCEVDYASEFRYRTPVLSKETLFVVVSQSGETIDTLGALEFASKFCKTLAVCNVVGSSIARKANSVVYTHAGPEISVASTKAFTTQLTLVYLLALYLGEKRGVLSKTDLSKHLNDLVHLPSLIDRALGSANLIEKIAKKYSKSKHFLFIGRGLCYPVALEGALKLKEISYIYAEGYPAGELKHGPIALVDEETPVVVVCSKSDLSGKTLSNMKEVEARGAKVIAVTDMQFSNDQKQGVAEIIEMPHINPYLSPIVLTLPLQLMAYYIAVMNGTDVDQPRNLAKSVTVE